jgi:hypothetical protein
LRKSAPRLQADQDLARARQEMKVLRARQAARQSIPHPQPRIREIRRKTFHQAKGEAIATYAAIALSKDEAAGHTTAAIPGPKGRSQGTSTEVISNSPTRRAGIESNNLQGT